MPINIIIRPSCLEREVMRVANECVGCRAGHYLSVCVCDIESCIPGQQSSDDVMMRYVVLIVLV